MVAGAPKAKVVFIDIDGVLIPRRALFLSHNRTPWQREDPAAVQRTFDPIAVTLVGRLVELSGARLVASTSWRHYPGRDVITKLMRTAGWDPQPFWHERWLTPFSRGRTREEEILHWFEEDEPIARWVSLDDHARPRGGGVRIDPNRGIQLDDYRTAALLLDVIDPLLGEADSWPAWTQWGERAAVRHWLDDAFAGPDDVLQEVQAIPDAHRHFSPPKSVQWVLDAADPWSEPDGPAAFLQDPRSVEVRSVADGADGSGARRPGAPTGADGVWLPCIPPIGRGPDSLPRVQLDVDQRTFCGEAGFSPPRKFCGRDAAEVIAAYHEAAATFRNGVADF
jgi:hypothetical protein